MTTKELVIHNLKAIRREFSLTDIDITEDTVIYGSEQGLNSLQLVRLVVELEDGALHQMGKTITIANEKALSRKNSPFRTVGTMTEYLDELLNA